MEKKEALAAIYNLSGRILTGEATEEEIKAAVDLAQKHDVFEILKDELISTTHMLMKRKIS